MNLWNYDLITHSIRSLASFTLPGFLRGALGLQPPDERPHVLVGEQIKPPTGVQRVQTELRDDGAWHEFLVQARLDIAPHGVDVQVRARGNQRAGINTFSYHFPNSICGESPERSPLRHFSILIRPYFTAFWTMRCMIAATSARVAVAVGRRVLSS